LFKNSRIVQASSKSSGRRRQAAIFFSLTLFMCIWGCLETTSGHIWRRKKTVESAKGEVFRVITEDVRIQFPPNQRDVSTASLSDSETCVSVGGVYKPLKEDKTSEIATKWGWIISAVFAGAATLLLVARAWIPVIPLIAPLACGGFAAVFMVMPSLIDRYLKEFGLLAVGI